MQAIRARNGMMHRGLKLFFSRNNVSSVHCCQFEELSAKENLQLRKGHSKWFCTSHTTSELSVESVHASIVSNRTVKHSSSLDEFKDALNTPWPSIKFASAALVKLSKFVRSGELSREEAKMIIESNHEKVFSFLESGAGSLETRYLISAVTALDDLCIAPESPNLLQAQLIDILPSLSLNQLIQIITTFDGASSSSQQIVQSSFKQIEVHLLGITSEKEFVSVMHLYNSPKYTVPNRAKIVKQLEEQASTLAKSFTAKSLCEILCILGASGRRNKPLLKVLSESVQSSSLGNVTSNKLCRVLMAIGHLHFYDTGLASIIVEQLWQNLQKVEGNAPMSKHISFVNNILSAMSSVHFIKREVIDSILQEILSNLSTISLPETNISREMLKTVSSSARLGHRGDLVQKLIQALDGNVLEANDLLELVWSSAVLQYFPHSSLQQLFSQNCLNELLAPDRSSSDSVIQSRACRLRHIISEVLCSGDETLKECIPENHRQRIPVVQLQARSKRSAVRQALASLEKFAPAPSYHTPGVTSQSAHLIDAVLLVDSAGRVQPVTSDNADFTPIALRVLEYTDQTLGKRQTLGPVAMLYRHLIAEGYKVLELDSEFQSLKSSVERVQYIQDKLKTLVY